VFDISITGEPIDGLDPGSKAVYGKITIGDFSEDILIGLARWNPARYEQQWKAAVARLVEGADRSALIVEYVEPQHSYYVMLWPMFREDKTVYIQNRMLFLNQLSGPFSAEAPWNSIEKRKTVGSKGQRISEWVTNVENLRDFLKRSCEVD
jgi:hypothetical protein